jgi:anti-sigma28 factor (negative regulator of flagellin synthesis)
MNWVEDKQNTHEERIDQQSIKVEMLEQRLEQAEFLEKSLIRLEAKVEMLKELIRDNRHSS